MLVCAAAVVVLAVWVGYEFGEHNGWKRGYHEGEVETLTRVDRFLHGPR